MRSQLPTLDLDAVFEAKEELAIAVKAALSQTMENFGFQILQGKKKQLVLFPFFNLLTHTLA